MNEELKVSKKEWIREDACNNIDNSINELVFPVNAEIQNELIITGSHAVKSPLTSLITGIQLISCSKKDISPHLHEIVYSLEKSVLGLKNLLLDIFSALKIVNDLNMDNIETINFPAIIEAVKNRIGFKQNQQVEVSVQPDAINIKHNQRIIETVLNVLLENASLYSSDGAKIALMVSIINNELNITVSDNGTGICENEINKICDPFFRSKMHKTNGFERTGLGLTIVNNIVKKFNGDLQIISEQGKGSTFTVILPIISI